MLVFTTYHGTSDTYLTWKQQI